VVGVGGGRGDTYYAGGGGGGDGGGGGGGGGGDGLKQGGGYDTPAVLRLDGEMADPRVRGLLPELVTLVFVLRRSDTFARSVERRWAGACRGEAGAQCECDVPEACGCGGSASVSNGCRPVPPGDP